MLITINHNHSSNPCNLKLLSIVFINISVFSCKTRQELMSPLCGDLLLRRLWVLQVGVFWVLKLNHSSIQSVVVPVIVCCRAWSIPKSPLSQSTENKGSKNWRSVFLVSKHSWVLFILLVKELIDKCFLKYLKSGNYLWPVILSS